MMFTLKPTQETIKVNKNADKISLNIKVNSVKELFDVMKEEDINVADFNIFNVLETKLRDVTTHLREVK